MEGDSLSSVPDSVLRSLGTRLGGRRPNHVKRASLMNLSMQEAHSHQFRHTFHYGAALRFDGFALLFNILCERQESRVRGKRRVRKGREGGRERGGERRIRKAREGTRGN